MRYLFSFLLLLLTVPFTRAQELNATVKVIAPKLRNTDPKVFKTLEQALSEFLNGQKWTNDQFEDDERIKCNFQLTIQEELSNNRFKAELAVKSFRPIYNSDQETVLFSHLDKDLTFTYQEFQPIQYVRDNYTDELSHTFAFYVYTILGLDYDSFAPKGGTPFFQELQSIVNVAPRSADGWVDDSKKRNRFQIMKSLTDPRAMPFHDAMYEYHRLGLDVMAEDVTGGRAKILDALRKIDRVYADYREAFILQIFVNSKTNELVEIFKPAPANEKSAFVNIFTKIDASRAHVFRRVFG